MKLIHLINAQPSIQILIDSLAKTKGHIKPKIIVGRAMRKIQPILEEHNKDRQKVINEFAAMNEDRSEFILNEDKTEHTFATPEDFEKYNVEVGKLQNEEVKVEIEMIDLDDIADVDLILPNGAVAMNGNQKIEANDFTVLVPLIGVLVKE